MRTPRNSFGVLGWRPHSTWSRRQGSALFLFGSRAAKLGIRADQRESSFGFNSVRGSKMRDYCDDHAAACYVLWRSRAATNVASRRKGALFGRRAPLKRARAPSRVGGVFLRSADDAFLYRRSCRRHEFPTCPHGAASEPRASAGLSVFAFRFRDISCVFIARAGARRHKE